MLAIVNSTALTGLEGQLVRVEADVSNGLPAFDLVGLPDVSVKEARERVRSAIRNAGFEFPVKRITVNLALTSVNLLKPETFLYKFQSPPAQKRYILLFGEITGIISI
ncbi:MAG: magnesium chelatase, partial [Actinobacteria bacterium]|nr:magnesium chelatase [Actinomycetota bacterium]